MGSAFQAVKGVIDQLVADFLFLPGDLLFQGKPCLPDFFTGFV
jgi:hypothetical protein